VYASIPNSAAGTGNYDGYYIYRASRTFFFRSTVVVY
jgi:hypothetical protein